MTGVERDRKCGCPARQIVRKLLLADQRLDDEPAPTAENRRYVRGLRVKRLGSQSLIERRFEGCKGSLAESLGHKRAPIGF